MKYSRLPFITQTTPAQQKHPSGKTSTKKPATKKLIPISAASISWYETLQVNYFVLPRKVLPGKKGISWNRTSHDPSKQLPPWSSIICTSVQAAFGLVYHSENSLSGHRSSYQQDISNVPHLKGAVPWALQKRRNPTVWSCLFVYKHHCQESGRKITYQEKETTLFIKLPLRAVVQKALKLAGAGLVIDFIQVLEWGSAISYHLDTGCYGQLLFKECVTSCNQ